ncbi:unnamed protein product [Lepeophtheirus salmonis]|uniref:(salmon louse) hypothetical protein n=1 Tax=Lepeophtheirus salmonis TaxID=72036 RepID=A0A7R8CR00_LEPSM|nr:unnamed protein product [Lepeophtheirus salmonis]CAF2866446.1 unnamed protein product [Lepeophtheirus salmonis]
MELYVLCEDDNIDEEESNSFAPSSSKSTNKKDRTIIPRKLIKNYSGRDFPQWKGQIIINKLLQQTQAKLEQFIATLLIMSLQKLCRIRNYWSSDFSAGNEIRQTCSRDRWGKIKRCLHLVNNEEMPLRNHPVYD